MARHKNADDVTDAGECGRHRNWHVKVRFVAERRGAARLSPVVSTRAMFMMVARVPIANGSPGSAM